jgi:hypothetical protein
MKRLVISCIVFLIALIAPPIATLMVFYQSAPILKFMAPGEAEFHIKSSGVYFLWNDYISTHEQQRLELPEQMPENTTITIMNSNGTALEQIPSSSDSALQSTDVASKELFGFQASPGIYKLKVDLKGEQRPLTIRPDVRKRITSIIVPVTIVSIIIGIFSFCIVCWSSYSIIKARQSKRLSV